MYFVTEADSDEDGLMWGQVYDDDCTVRISVPEVENGERSCDAEPLSWLNSARVSVSHKDDAVYCAVSVGDPRGAFVFTVRRLSDGRMVIHTPVPGEGMPHMETAQLHEGTLIVVDRRGAGPDSPAIFSVDPNEDEEEEEDEGEEEEDE